MTPELTLTLQLVILAATAVLAWLAASSARRAASFDVTRDFDALASAVAKLQQLARSTQMKQVRAAALTPDVVQPVSQSPSMTPMTHEQLREISRRKNGAHA